jgi:hypothetical protein
VTIKLQEPDNKRTGSFITKLGKVLMRKLTIDKLPKSVYNSIVSIRREKMLDALVLAGLSAHLQHRAQNYIPTG